MKNIAIKYISVFSFMFAGVITLSGQVPQGFNYMAIARDAEKNILPDLEITVRIAILDGDLAKAWEEDHVVTTNGNGLFQIIVGQGVSTDGGYAPAFNEIDWILQPMYIKTSLYVTDSWLDMGTAQLQSVPYAMVSETTLQDLDNPFAMNGDTIMLLKSVDVVGNYEVTGDDALFEVKRQDGQTMFAVYNQGVRINVPMIDAVKGVKGGFSIGGFDGAKGTTYNLFTLNKDSARIYVDKTPDLAKGAKGGFSVGGFDAAGKGPVQEYLSITPDSARIYVKNAGKASKGGFSVGGFDAKGTSNFLDITPENYFIGHESGSKILETGLYNSVIGYQAGKSLTSGGYNTMLGFNAGLNASSGNNNILIGNYAGNNLTTGIHNTLIGNSAGYNHTDQQFNVMIGTAAGANVNSSFWEGSFNTFAGINSGYQLRYSKENVLLGTNAGYWLDNGKGNTFIGIDAGRSRSEAGEPHTWRPEIRADFNTIIGDKAGYFVTNSYNNVIVGNQAGFNIGDGDGNVFLGNQAGFNESGNEKLYIDNSSADPPLMYGDFSVNQLGINTKTLGKTLNVGGDLGVSGNITAVSVTAPVLGNVTGDVIGNLTGNVRGVDMGKIFLPGDGEVQSTAGEKFKLLWNRGDGILIIDNQNNDFPCHYWYRMISKGISSEGSGAVDPLTSGTIISGANFNGSGIEVHFGFTEPGTGYCSVWIQFIDGVMVGHYMKYEMP